MSPAQELARCLEHARQVNDLLPVDHDADRIAAEFMRRTARPTTTRKLTRRPK